MLTFIETLMILVLIVFVGAAWIFAFIAAYLAEKRRWEEMSRLTKNIEKEANKIWERYQEDEVRGWPETLKQIDSDALPAYISANYRIGQNEN
jgi:hypothetical protein